LSQVVLQQPGLKRLRASMTRSLPVDTPGHSTAFRDATKTTLGRKGLLTGSEVMAMSAIELMADKRTMGEMKKRK